MDQIIKMASVVAKLQTTLDVYEGMYAKVEDAKVIIVPFNEIGTFIKSALCTHIIIGCTAVFSDPEETWGNKNMSLKNIVVKYEGSLSQEAKDLFDEIKKLVADMNLKEFRNKHVSHYGLEECLGYKEVKRDISINKIRLLLQKALVFFNLLLRDAKIGHPLNAYSKIPTSRSTEVFLKRLANK